VSFVRDERAAISATLDELGPDAPTLCEGWTTADLAAHIVLRERRPDAAGGIALSFLSGYTGSVQNRLKTGRPYAELVQFIRQGPPIWSPYRIPGLDKVVNSVELFVHHEDARRAQPGWEPRVLPPQAEEALWRQLKSGARIFLRKSPVGVLLRRTGGGEVAATKAAPEVVVSGDAGELILFAFGRGNHARVTFEGDEGAVRRLRETPLGM
jgi:uncharacterized protein (TIGR03085 family)